MFGVTFYPDQWPPEVWEENFQGIKETGFNLVRFGEMSWDWVEPEEDKFDFSGLDRALDLCQKHGLKVLLGVPTCQAPNWLIKKYPEARPVAEDGTLYPEYGPRPNVCKDNPNYQKLAARLTQRLAQRYHHHPALLYWQIDNEPVYPPLDATTLKDYCHCPYSRQAFIRWAKKKYQTLEKLNKIWGAKFWTTTFSNFEEITTPKAGFWDAVSPHIFLDWYRFKSERLRDWLSFLKQIIRKYDKIHKVGTNGFIGICPRVQDHDVLAEKMDWYGIDLYPKGNRMKDLEVAMFADLWRSFCRGEFHVTELQGGANVRWGNPDHLEGEEIKTWVEILFNRGASVLLFHAWRPALFGSETGGFGILKPDGSPTKRLEIIKRIIKSKNVIPKSQDLKAEVAIVYHRSCEVQCYQEQGPPRGVSGQWAAVRDDIGLMYGFNSILGAYQVVYKPDRSIDFILERHLNEGKLNYKTILFPNPYTLSPKQYQNLKKFVQNGGILIIDARFGLKDQNAHLYPKPLIEDLLAVRYDHFEVTKDGFLDILENHPQKPMIITKKVGKGKVVYANHSIFLKIKKGSEKASVLRKFAW
ncbi:MAG: beta-galactosidase [Candidatus Margulisiibacteriota bacterium]